MNAVGERTLEYLRGERDLFEERKRLAEIREALQNSKLPYWVTGASKRRTERFWQMVALLQENSRMSLVDMSRKLKIPVSPLFDALKDVEKVFCFTIVLRDNERDVLISDTLSAELEPQVPADTGQETP